MGIFLFVLIFCLGFILLMFKQALENNLLHHEIQLKGEVEQVSLFFISDIHLRTIDDQMIQKIDKSMNAVIIGGDLADKRTPISRIYHNIHLLQTLGPVYFIWGNNDREVGEDRLRAIFNETGVQIIENNAVLLPLIYNKCWLSAIDDLSSKKARLNQAFEKCNEKDTIVFISHNPQIFPKVRRQKNVQLLLAGHLHGGQIRFGPFGLHQNGSFSTKDGVPTLISNGYGTTMLPLRFGAKPECHMIDLNFTK